MTVTPYRQPRGMSLVITIFAVELDLYVYYLELSQDFCPIWDFAIFVPLSSVPVEING